MSKPRIEEISPFVRQLMERHQVDSLQALADKTGLPRMTIQEYAKVGRTWTQYKRLLEISQKLEISPGELLSGLSQQTAK